MLNIKNESLCEKTNMKVKPDEVNCLVQVTQDDAVIKRRILELLQLSSFERRFALNIWLEQLRQRNAYDNLMYILSCLFDDNVAIEVITVIKNSHK